MQHIAGHSQQPAEPQRIRFRLERWGISEVELDAILQSLNTAEGRIEWVANDSRQCDLEVHLVDVARLSGPSHGAAWNALGPVEALRSARARGVPAIALVRGNASSLPMVRMGCWITSTTQNFTGAARILSGAIIGEAGGECLRSARDRLTKLASHDALARVHRIVSVSSHALMSTIRDLLQAARGQAYAAPLCAYIGMGEVADVDSLRSGFPTHILQAQAATVTEADAVLVYPWPDFFMVP